MGLLLNIILDFCNVRMMLTLYIIFCTYNTNIYIYIYISGSCIDDKAASYVVVCLS